MLSAFDHSRKPAKEAAAQPNQHLRALVGLPPTQAPSDDNGLLRQQLALKDVEIANLRARVTDLEAQLALSKNEPDVVISGKRFRIGDTGGTL